MLGSGGWLYPSRINKFFYKKKHPISIGVVVFRNGGQLLKTIIVLLVLVDNMNFIIVFMIEISINLNNGK
jgi:hypothetical protein